MPKTDIHPLGQLRDWIDEETRSGSVFAHGAVLSTVSKLGHSRSRMLGVSFGDGDVPKFHTTPTSRKIEDIKGNISASLTFGWHRSLRSVSLEGQLTALDEMELDADWSALDAGFRRSYHIFGYQSGADLGNPDDLDKEREKLPSDIEARRPGSFIGFKFANISRIAFYAVGDGNFATSEVFEKDANCGTWRNRLVVP